MKKEFSKNWKASKQPRKQRKYVMESPLHLRNKLVSAHLSKDLIKKYSIRNIPLRNGDKVKIMRGKFKKTTGTVTDVDLKKLRILVSGVEMTKKDGSKSPIPLHPSKLMITELVSEDKRRLKNIVKEAKK